MSGTFCRTDRVSTDETGHTRLMLLQVIGIVMSAGTVAGLSWDWWRHPEL
jgi:hypothetical protein